MNKSELQQVIVNQRFRLGYTQTAFAKELGVERPHVWRLENRFEEMTMQSLLAAFKLLELQLSVNGAQELSDIMAVIKKRRKAFRVTQKTMAEALDTSHSLMSLLETNLHSRSFTTLYKACEYLGLDIRINVKR